MRGRPSFPAAALAVAAVVVVGLAALLAAHQPAPRRRAPGVVEVATDALGPGGGGDPATGGVPWWVLPVVVVVVGLGLSLLWFVFRDLMLAPGDGIREPDRHLDDDDDTHGEDDLATATRRALTDASDDLDAGVDAREVVVACWVRIEEAAQAAGLGRRPAETATDVARRWLAAGPDRAAVDDLAALYHLARYSTHPLTAEHRTRARAALRGALGPTATPGPLA